MEVAACKIKESTPTFSLDFIGPLKLLWVYLILLRSICGVLGVF